jgi:RNA polymerase-associated protein CTR9
MASKLAERAIQFADTKRHAVLANAERGRLGFVAGDVADAGPFIAAAKSEDAAGVNILSELTLGQIAIKSGECPTALPDKRMLTDTGNLREALNFIEQTAKRLNGKGPVEYTVLHACLLAYPHPGMPADEIARNKATARQMLSDVHSQVVAGESDDDRAKVAGVSHDPDIFLDLATLWHTDAIDKAIGAYQTASNIFRDSHPVADESEDLDVRQIRTSSNLGSLFLLQGNVDSAEREYQYALEKLANETGQAAEVLKTDLAYNLARAYEENGDVVKASQWYRDVLRQHPEHMECESFIYNSSGA